MYIEMSEGRLIRWILGLGAVVLAWNIGTALIG